MIYNERINFYNKHKKEKKNGMDSVHEFAAFGYAKH